MCGRGRRMRVTRSFGPSSTMAEMAAQNATEAILAVQMIAANDAALLFLRRATADGQTVEGSAAHVLRASGLMRLFIEQLAAMAKLKGKPGQQKVVVEHGFCRILRCYL